MRSTKIESDIIGLWHRFLTFVAVHAFLLVTSFMANTANAQSCQCNWVQVTNTETYDLVEVSPSEWYINTKTTVRKSVDGGATWATTNWPLGIVRDGTSVVSAITHNGTRLVVGAIDNGMYISSNSGVSFAASGPTGFGCAAINMISLPSGTVLSTMGGFQRGIYRLPQGGTTWTKAVSFSGDFFDFSRLNTTVFATLQSQNHSGGLYASENDGQNWTQVMSTSGWDNPAVVEVNLDTVYFVDNKGRFHWFDRSANVARLLSSIPECALPNDLEVSMDGVFYVTNSMVSGAPVSNSPRVSYSTDRGRTWQSCQIAGVNIYHELSMVGGLHLGTNKGLYRLNLSGGSANPGIFNPLPDTTRVCGTADPLNAGAGYSSYRWSTGAMTQRISPTSSGLYTVTVTNPAGCMFSDSTYLSISQVDIQQSDTTICRGSSLELKSNVSKSSGSMHVNGANNTEGYAIVSNVANILPVGSSKTYECTFRMDDNVPIGKNAAIWSFGPEQLQNCKAFALKVSSSQCGSNRLWLWGHNCLEYCGPTIVPNTTYHAVTVVNGNNVKVYLNGVLQMNVNMNLAGVTSDKFFIWYGWDAHMMNGMIDDVRIWNFPWTQTDVTSAYSSCLLPDLSKLISGWDFNQNALASVVNIKSGFDDIDFKSKVSLVDSDISTCNSGNPSNIRWSTGETSEAITVKPLGTLTYYLTSAKVGSNCTDSVTIRVVSMDTSVSVQGTTSICSTSGSVGLQAGTAAAYQWLRDGISITGASTKAHQASQSGDYRVALISAEGCSDTSRVIRVNLNPNPVVSFTVDDSVKCIPDRRFTFVNQSSIATGALSYSWDFGNGTSSQSPSPTVQYSGVGIYRVTLRASSDFGCVQSVSKTMRVDSMPKAVRYAPVNALVNRPQTLDSRNIGVSWRWAPTVQLTGADMRSPVFLGDRDQQYLITIRNASGCATVDTLFVGAVKDYGIHVPGGFTPDNDGRNDRLYPIPVGIREVRFFKVFNRWGVLVFDNRSATASTGWDGMFKGIPAPMGTYAWIVEGIDVDGKLIRRTGNTILIR